MNPFSAPVLLGAAVVSSPTLWRALTGEARLEAGLTRYLVAVVLCWAGLSLVSMLVGPPARRVVQEDPAEQTEEVPSPVT